MIYVPVQVACGSKHFIVLAIPEEEYKKLSNGKNDQQVSLDKILSNPTWPGS
jgi:hypothetical protein